MHGSIEKLRPRLFILAGILGCGKSTWARTFFHPGQVVSSDAIREAKWPGEPYDAKRNEEVFGEFHRRIGDALEEGKDIVADATHLVLAHRRLVTDIAAYYDAEKHLIFFNNPDQALGRNASRKGNQCVPPDAMYRMLDLFQEARSAILDELYTSTTIIGATA